MSKELVEKKQNFELQIQEKKNEILTLLNETVISQLGLDINSNSKETLKKKQEVAMFVSKLVQAQDTSGKPAILSCTKESIRDCCLIYCNSGVDFYKNQAYLYPYGQTLTFMISKDGLISMAKKLDDRIEDFYGDVVYKNDIFEYSKVAGKTQIIKHIQPLENITAKIEDIVCAYGTCVYKDGTYVADIMTITEIQNALKTAHKNFTDTHKNNPKIMLSKFPMRRLAKQKVYQSLPSNVQESVLFEDEENEVKNEKVFVVNEEQMSNTTITHKPEPIKNKIVPEVIETTSSDWTEEEMQEALKESYEQEQKENDWKEVFYSLWKNELKDSGEWEMQEGSYSHSKKTVLVRKK